MTYKILEKVDMSKLYECDDIEAFENDLTHTYIGWSEEFGKRMKQAPVITWTCTDTVVGLYVYFFDEEFVAVGWQPYRKSDVELQWVSEEKAHKVRDFIFQLQSKNEGTSIRLYNVEQSEDEVIKIAEDALRSNQKTLEYLYEQGIYKRGVDI